MYVNIKGTSIILNRNSKSQTKQTQTKQTQTKQTKPTQTKPTQTKPNQTNMSYNRELVTNADLLDAPERSEQVERIQRQFGCTWEQASIAQNGFTLYIPHLGPVRQNGGKFIYFIMKNLGLGFLRKTTGEGAAKIEAIEIINRVGGNGKRDYQSCKIHFAFLFTKGDENAGNIGILQHLMEGKTNERTGQDVYNHLEVIYQDAGPNRYDSSKQDPARFWKVLLWRPGPERDTKPATPATPAKVKFTLVKAKDTSLTNGVVPVTEKVHFPSLTEAMVGEPIQRSNAVSPPGSPSFEDLQLAEEGFAKVGKGGKAK